MIRTAVLALLGAALFAGPAAAQPPPPPRRKPCAPATPST